MIVVDQSKGSLANKRVVKLGRSVDQLEGSLARVVRLVIAVDQLEGSLANKRVVRLG